MLQNRIQCYTIPPLCLFAEEEKGREREGERVVYLRAHGCGGLVARSGCHLVAARDRIAAFSVQLGGLHEIAIRSVQGKKHLAEE